jgi:branched-chain amino acid transport system substrate-binding protein
MSLLPRLCFIISALVTALMPLPAWSQKDQQTVLIGVLGPMTFHRGKNMRDAAQFAVDRVNQQGLQINGKNIRLELFVVDDKNELNLSVLAAHAAVAAGVIGVIGPLTTDASVATVKILSDAGIAQMATSAAGRQLTQLGYRNIFQFLGHSGFTADYLADSALKISKAQRIVVLDNDTILGIELAKNFIAAITRRHGNVVDTDKISANSSDFNSTIAKIRTHKADLVYFAGVTPQSDAFAARLRQTGLHTQLLVAAGGINAGFPHKTEQYPEGTLLLGSGTPVEKAADFKRLEPAYRSQYTTEILPYSWYTYDAVMMLVQAMKQANSTDPKLLPPLLHQMKYPGQSGNVSFAADGSAVNPSYTLFRAEQGRWKALYTMP